MSGVSEGILLGMGIPLMNISCNVSKDFLQKYDLKANDQILADESHKELTNEIISKFKVDYISGGSVQNSLRAAQWMLGTPYCMTFMGAIGDDQFGSIMANNSKAQGLKTVYQIETTTPTGTCACLIYKDNRSLVTYLGASQKFHLRHVLDNYSYVEKAKYFYVSGYHLIASPESVLYLAEHSNANQGKLFCLNLSAPYISQQFSKPLLEVFPYVDLLFGNETEALAFAELNKWKTKDMKSIAKLIADKDCKRNSGRTVVITQGKDSVLVAFTTSADVSSFAVKPISSTLIADTIGAGDAFVGGFFAQLVRDQPLDVCIESGIYAAQEVIQQIGCQFPKQMAFIK